MWSVWREFTSHEVKKLNWILLAQRPSNKCTQNTAQFHLNLTHICVIQAVRSHRTFKRTPESKHEDYDNPIKTTLKRKKP